jgi:hypothetical protein
MEQADLDWDGVIRRVDANFRARFFDIETVIFKIKGDLYQIHIDQSDDVFEGINKEFNNSIRPISYPVRLVNKKPEVFENLLPPIPDHLIPENLSGIDFNDHDLLHLLSYHFPDIHFYKLESTPYSTNVHIYLLEEQTTMGKVIPFLSAKQKEEIWSFLNALQLPYQFNLIEDHLSVAPVIEVPKIDNVVFNLYSDKILGKPKIEFLERDEALWFDNIGKIYENRFTKSDLYFLDELKYACYVDLSSFKNIDIRNFLFLYQTVYLSPPIEKDFIQWLHENRITEEEFAELIRRDRIKLVLSQPIFRYYEHGFFSILYQINPTAIITRRALAALQQIDLVEMADNYLFNDAATLKELKVFCEALGEHLPVDPKRYYELLTWPLKAKRASFVSLHQGGIMTMGAIGVNTVLDKLIGDKIGKDVSFEFTMNGANTHLAHALNATYFPYLKETGYSDAFYANVTGDFLNFIRNTTKDNIHQLSEVQNQPGQRIPVINPIEVIEIDDYASILELDDILTAANAFPKSQYLMNYLASLDPERRATTIQWYNKKIKELLNKKKKGQRLIDLGANAALDTIGLVSGAAYLGLGFELLKRGYQFTKKFDDLKAMRAKIDEAYQEDIHGANIAYLAQINRVAGVKRFAQQQ